MTTHTIRGSQTGSHSDAPIALKFVHLFGCEPAIFSAPGRVNLIGEHTDYNDGYVLPCAIHLKTTAAVSARNDHRLVVQSENFQGFFEFDLSALPNSRAGVWYDYVLGVLHELIARECPFTGANLLLETEIPIGSGLSSSAALEVAVALALSSLACKEIPPEELARLCQRAESHFVGVRVGIMDQLVSCLGRAHHAMLIDCRTLDCAWAPIPSNVGIVVANTMVRHELAGGEYNQRREDCDAATKIFSRKFVGVSHLRDVSTVQLEDCRDELGDRLYRRARHVISENERVLRAVHSLETGDLLELRDLLSASHESLRQDYEVSCRELDLMLQAAQNLPGFHGGRMTGGGFGGCTVNLVAMEQIEHFSEMLSQEYRRLTGILPQIQVCHVVDGAIPPGSRATRPPE